MSDEVKTILIVEDELKMQQALRDRMQEEGYRVLAAADVDRALALVRAENVDLVILDLRLGDKSGLDFIDELKDDASIDDASIIIVVLTAIADPAMMGDVIARGPADYLVKSDNSLDDIANYVRKKMTERGDGQAATH